MACNLGPDFLCNSITSLRVAEDAVTAIIIAAIIYLVLDLAFNTIREGPLVKRMIVFAVGFAPFLLWKLFGTFRRIFLESSSPWYGTLNEFGEVMEGISALFILGALVYMYLMLRPSKTAE